MSIMQNALAARQAGFDEVGKFRQTLGQNMAGNALAAGDSRGAANALFSTGQLDAGEIVQQRQEGRQQRQQANQWATEDRQAGQDKQAQEMRAMAMVQAGKALQGIPMEQRLEVLNTRVAPMFQRIGIPTDVFQGMTPEDLSDESLSMFVNQVERELEIVKGSDGSFSAVDKRTGEMVSQYVAPRYQTVGQGQSLVEIGGGGQGGGAPAGGGQGFDGFYNNYLAGVEGGFAADDGNGAPVNFGINQGANPDVNVRGLSPERAKELLRQRYWEPSGADQLPPALGAIHGDTAINMGLGAAKTLLEQSGGDPQRYLELREQRYRSIAERDPSKARYLNTWLRRNQQLAQFAGSQPQQGGAPAARVIAQGPQREAPRPATAAEKAQYGIPERTPAQIKPDGSIAVLGGAKEPTVDAKQAAAFTYRVLGANDRLNELADGGIFKPQTVTSQLVRDDGNGVLRIVARTDNDRRFIQAAKEWLAPILRRDTGAAVTDSELANYMDIYIPKYEDDQATLKQKAEARQDAMIALAGQAGSVFGDVYGDRKFVSKYPSATRKRDGSAMAPAPAVAELRRDPSPEARREFDEVFGQGAAARALGGR